MTWKTLSPDAYRRWQGRTAIRYSGDGYTVDFLSQSAAKYVRDGKSITFSSEPLARMSGDGKTHWVLTVYVHRPLRWDSVGGEITDAGEEQEILSGLETALKAKIGDYELVRDAT